MRHALAAAALLLAACDGLLFAELDVPELRVTLPSQGFVASDTSAPEDWCDPAEAADPPCIATALELDLGAQVPVLAGGKAGYDLRLTDLAISLAATDGDKDLGGVKLLTIRIADGPPSTGAGTVVASYARPAGAAAPSTIAVAGNSSVDLGAYLEAGRLPIRIELVVDRPTPAFVADVQAGFALRVSLDYGSFL